MIRITNVSTPSGNIITHEIEKSAVDQIIDGTGLTLLPAVIDPHVHFRIPGAEHKEDWRTAAAACIAGGVTTVFDMPNNSPAITNSETFNNKKTLIEEQLKESGIPLRYKLWLGATTNNTDEIIALKEHIIGVKVFMGSSTGNLLVDKRADQEKIFQTCAEHNIVVGVHAEHEPLIQKHIENIGPTTDIVNHSKIRDREVAVQAVKEAIEMCRTFGTKTYILHTSTKDELDLIQAAKKEGLPIYCETTPHHLLLNESNYDTLGTKAQMNPPLRTAEDNEALWKGIRDGIIDVVATDHAPHTLEEKNQPYGSAPSGVPGVENSLAILLDAHNKDLITLDDIVRVTSTNATNIFSLEVQEDVVLVNTKLQKTVKNEKQKTKCGWSPYEGMQFTGWPQVVILEETVYNLQ